MGKGEFSTMKLTSIQATAVQPPPEWALRPRHLINAMNAAASLLPERYARDDGTFIWREDFIGMDGSDDGYESYHTWPLFYALGGGEDLDAKSRFLWDAITRQFTDYGQVHREFDGYYDWMHHGESYLYFYYFGLTDPRHALTRERACRFADFYTGADPEAANWDAEKRMIRSPINGSRGPCFEYTWDDWSTIRWVLAMYPVPFDDLDVPVEMREWFGEQNPIADWNDDAVYGKILEALNQRQMRGDVPLNLASTSLVANAFLYTGENHYRQWILDYLEAWAERIAKNGGLCPDNIGHNDRVGETMDGKWWGGYYGWSWPHGFMNIIESLSIAAMNAVLLSGDMSYLEIPRSQLQRIMELGRVEDGRLLVPHRHTDSGWRSYRPLQPSYVGPLWYMSQDERDLQLIEQLPESQTDWADPAGRDGFGLWYSYLQGRYVDYPLQALKSECAGVNQRLQRIREDDSAPTDRDVHHWQERNPVSTETLVQQTCGGPAAIYHGGLLHVRLRYFDAVARRPGLPVDTAALVTGFDADSVSVELCNLSLMQEQRLVLQAGAFGEHEFTEVYAGGGEAIKADGPHVKIILPPGAQMTLQLGMRRYCRPPSYGQPAL